MDQTLYQNIQKKLENKIDFSNKNDDLKNLLLECNKIQSNILGYKIMTQVFQAIQKSGQKVLLMDQDQIQIIKTCKSLAILGYLHDQEQIKIINKDKEFRENIRVQIQDLQQQGNLEKAFLLDEVMKYKSRKYIEEYTEISKAIKTMVNLLIDFGNDSFNFTQIFDVILNALLLTGNNSTIGRDYQLLSILDKLQKLLDETRSPYQWTIVMESILNASTYMEEPTDLVQPNMITRIILFKIPYIEDIFKYFGKYLGKCYKFEYRMFEAMLNFGVTQQTLELILQFSKQFVKDYQTDILVEMRKNLIPNLIKYMRTINCFDQTQNLFNYFLISSFSQVGDAQLDQQHFSEIITNYYNNFDLYNDKQLQRIANFLGLLQQPNKKSLKNYDLLESKLKKKYIQIPSSNSNILLQNEQIQIWFQDENSQIEDKQPKLIGLRNLLNTCYLNSFIQALFWTLDFRNLILNEFKREEIVFLKPFSLKTNFLRCFLFLDSMSDEIDYTPLLLKRSLREPYKTDDRQQDAAEFGVHLFEDMEKNFDQEEYKKIKEIFYGMSKSTFQCKNCDKPTKGPDEEFMYITLNFENNRREKDEIEKMILRHQMKEQITFNCEQCKKTSQSTRTLEFSKLPKNIIIQINRFEFQNGERSKINDQINLKPKIQIKENQKQLTYELYSIIIHFGQIPDAGHYTVYCKVKDEWYRYDDSIVTKIEGDFDRVQRNFRKEETPYLLFFRRVSG